MILGKSVPAMGLLLGLHFSSLDAGTIVCSGTVDQLSYHASNQVLVKLSSMNKAAMVCNTDAVWQVPGTSYQTSPGACKTLYSTFLTARTTGEPLQSVYFDGDQVPATCDSWESWRRVNIRYFIY